MKYLLTILCCCALANATAADTAVRISGAEGWLTLENYRPTTGSQDTHSTIINAEQIRSITLVDNPAGLSLVISLQSQRENDRNDVITMAIASKTDALRIFREIRSLLR